MDYRDILHSHSTASECVRLFNAWFMTVKNEYDRIVKDFERLHIERKPAIELRLLNLGDHLA